MRSKRALPILILLTTAALTFSPIVAAQPISLNLLFDIAQSCSAQGHFTSLNCPMNSLQAGQIILVEAADIPLPNVTDTFGDHFTLVREAPLPGTSYDLEVFVATALLSGDDNVNIAGIGSYTVMNIHVFDGATGVEDSSDGSGNSTTSEVTGFAPLKGTVVIAAALIQNNAGMNVTSAHAGLGYTEMTDVSGIVEEGAVASGNTTTSPFILGAPVNWAEVSVALFASNASGPPAPVPQFGAPAILVAAMGIVVVAVMKRSKILKF
jgi:hypothetical protein